MNQKVVMGVVAALLFGAGVALGWYGKPSVVRVEEKLKTVEVEKQVVVEKEVVRVEVVRVKDTQVVERYHREKTEEVRADGSSFKKEVEDRNIDTLVKEKENSTTVQVVEVEKQVVVEREVVVEKVSEPVLAAWHVGVLGGVSPTLLPVPTMGSYFIGAEVERRLVGPLWLGVWGAGTTDGQGFAGAKLGLEF